MTSFQHILDEYGASLRRIAASYAPPGAAREDLEQEILAAIYHALSSFRGDASVRTYVFRIAHNCGIGVIKARARAPHTEPLDVSHVIDPRDPETQLSEQQRYERLASAVRELPLGLRQPLTLRLEGLSYDEIGIILGLTTSNVGARLHRATARLKELMKEVDA